MGGHLTTGRQSGLFPPPNKSRKKRFCSELENSRQLLSTLEPSNCNEFWHRPLKIIYLSFARGWMASEPWKWEKLDKIREAIGLGGPLRFLGWDFGKSEGFSFHFERKRSLHHSKRSVWLRCYRLPPEN